MSDLAFKNYILFNILKGKSIEELSLNNKVVNIEYEDLKQYEETNFKAINNIKELIKNKLYQEALSICKNFSNDLIIESLKIQALSHVNRKEAYKVCTSFPKDNFLIKAQEIALLIQDKRLNEALVLCHEPAFMNLANIKSQEINILIKLGRLDEALEITNNPAFENNIYILSQKIKILIAQKKLNEALAICENPLYKNEVAILSQYLNILISIKRPKLVEELIKNELFNTSEILIWQKQTALEFLKVSELRSLEIDTLSLEDILSLDIHEYYKIILKFWYYALNKYPLKTILLELKSLIITYQNTEFINVLSKLQKYFNTKRKFVDKVFYLNLLDDAMYIILRDKRTPQKRSL